MVNTMSNSSESNESGEKKIFTVDAGSEELLESSNKYRSDYEWQEFKKNYEIKVNKPLPEWEHVPQFGWTSKYTVEAAEKLNKQDKVIIKAMSTIYKQNWATTDVLDWTTSLSIEINKKNILPLLLIRPWDKSLVWAEFISVDYKKDPHNSTKILSYEVTYKNPAGKKVTATVDHSNSAEWWTVIEK